MEVVYGIEEVLLEPTLLPALTQPYRSDWLVQGQVLGALYEWDMLLAFVAPPLRVVVQDKPFLSKEEHAYFVPLSLI
jgi:hypothetical protein